ncbi:MAG: VanZ family protein [Pirellulales bacterium]|nr:VanZ family protein [Pirellulales bacterium]
MMIAIGLLHQDDRLMTTARLLHLLRRATPLVLAIYWLGLFVGTHIPIPESVGIGNKDKWIHFFAYGGLGALAMIATAWRVSANVKAWHLLLIVVAFAAFGGFDELTQPLVGREADRFDWFADVAGVIIGAAAGAAVMRLLRRTGTIAEIDAECELHPQE